MAKNIIIISGEPSGDMHAANLVRDLKSLDGDLCFYGMGGELSRKAGVEILFDITKLALVGAVEVLKHVGEVKKARDAILNKTDSLKPGAAILVDYPGFNLAMARELHKRGITVIYYISPQLWAWAPERIHLIKRYVSKMVVFFKFEEELYRRYSIDSEFVGHPLLDIVKVTSPRTEVIRRYGLSDKKNTIAILPGSRLSEIGAFLPILVASAEMIARELGDVQFLISKHPDRDISMYNRPLSGAKFDYRMAEGDLHNILGACDFALVASGTATLETSILGTPYLIVYKANLITYLLYKLVAKIKFLGIANVIAGREIVPEFKQYDMTPAKIAAKTVELIRDPLKLACVKADLAAVKSSLGSSGAGARAAHSIMQVLEKI